MTNLNIDKDQAKQALQNGDSFKIKDFELKIDYDNDNSCLDSPRDWEGNIGKMICFHKRYDLGDKHDYSNPDEFHDFLKINQQSMNDYNKVNTTLRGENNLFIQNKKNLILLPLYLYDHSGITIATTPFHCRWDSGQVGYIYAKKSKKRTDEETIKILNQEVKLYDQYITGEIYKFEISKKQNFLDGLWGFYQKDDCIDEAIEALQNIISNHREEPKQLKLF